MKFERIITKKTVIVEEKENDKEFAARIFKTLADEFDGGVLYCCSNYVKGSDCTKCKMYLPIKKAIKNVPTTGETQCAIIAIKYLARHIAEKL
ncbi:MAG: hypothetical protein WC365_01310 [Candidatus Babeliales bacterium]|jgi:hypothetical protein